MNELGPSFQTTPKPDPGSMMIKRRVHVRMSLMACGYPTGADLCLVARQIHSLVCLGERVAVTDVLLCLSPTSQCG